MSFLFTTRRSGGAGLSISPYDFNLAIGVGDRPEDVLQRRVALAATIDGIERITWMDQVHGREVAVIDGPSADVILGVDGLVTRSRGVALAALAADCIPIVLESKDVVGIAHAGRLGAVADVMAATVSAMTGLGAEAITAHLGPSICGGCYEVPLEMRAEVSDALPGSWSQTRSGTPSLDLAAGVARRLEGLGVEVTRDPRCTYEDSDLYSFRRDGVTGRFAGLVWLP